MIGMIRALVEPWMIRSELAQWATSVWSMGVIFLRRVFENFGLWLVALYRTFLGMVYIRLSF